MQIIDERLIYSATDLVGFIECAHLANLNRAVAEHKLEPPREQDPVLDRIAQRGQEHEQRFLAGLQADDDGLAVVEVSEDPDRELPVLDRLRHGREATLEAMRTGADVIYQAVLFDGRRQGYADFLRRVEVPSDLGAWSYEVWDTKLARHAKASAVLQLSLYSDMVGAMQGRVPERMHLALGGVEAETVSFRVSDYAAYYRLVARRFEEHLAGESPADVASIPTAPEPTDHCAVCRWSLRCSRELRAADDLSRVAGLTSRQRRGLIEFEIPTRAALAEVALPLASKVPGASPAALERIHEQARVQVEGDRRNAPYFERIPLPRNREGVLAPNFGLGMLPPPSEGDLFFDIEGDPFYSSPQGDGVDYLFGVIEPAERDASGAPDTARFHAFWSIEDGEVTPGAERRAFEAFIDLTMDRLRRDPGMHVYHYAPYEPTAVKRLAGRYGTREAEVDELLRGGVFVDLYRAVRQGIRAAVESYSIKKLEPLCGFTRDVDLKDAGTSIVEFETWLELSDTNDEGIDREKLLADIEAYNRDDCVSTWRLRAWLEEQRAALEAETGDAIPRPADVRPEDREASERQKRIAELVERLTHDIPESDQTPEQHGRWLLAQMLNWHAREQKSFWWRYYFLKDELTDEERCEESDALGELTPEGIVGEIKQSWVYRFRFPPQEHKFRSGDKPHDPQTGKSAGEIVDLDDLDGHVDLKVGKKSAEPTCTSLIPGDPIRPNPKPEAIERLAEFVLEHGIEGDGPYRVARDLLLHAAPRFSTGDLEAAPGESIEDVARRLVIALDASYLAVQGPPGSGKTTVGGKMIADLVAAGLRVGVTAGSHKVIGNLLKAAAEAAAERDLHLRIGQKGDGDGPTFDGATDLSSNGAVVAALTDRTMDIVGGTTWLWAREDMEGLVDVLFIDEAGQMSLADALAASLAARNVVLLGDPQQLDQPLQGTHPPGAERSALAHVLDGASTMPADRGLFLDGSWRMHPAITAYTSEVFYEGRLHSHPGREQQRIDAPGSVAHGTGLRFVAVEHRQNSSDSPEEALAIERLLDALLVPGATTTDAHGVTSALTNEHVLLITPYNAQVRLLEESLPGVHVGTVDKFQGQQAPVSIYSMATSSAEEAPRGMEFLYSLNRLNVATSRAKSVAIVVASPDLLWAKCRTPRQMRLVNALARLVELAEAGAPRAD